MTDESEGGEHEGRELDKAKRVFVFLRRRRGWIRISEMASGSSRPIPENSANFNKRSVAQNVLVPRASKI